MRGSLATYGQKWQVMTTWKGSRYESNLATWERQKTDEDNPVQMQPGSRNCGFRQQEHSDLEKAENKAQVLCV